jgi:hypothetical protein
MSCSTQLPIATDRRDIHAKSVRQPSDLGQSDRLQIMRAFGGGRIGTGTTRVKSRVRH